MKKSFIVLLYATIMLAYTQVNMGQQIYDDEAMLSEEAVVVPSGIVPVGNTAPSRSLRILYETPFGRVPRRMAIRGRVNKGCGALYKNKASRTYIKKFVKKHGINMDEAEKPLKEYKTINDVFIRKLKPGARPVSDIPNALVSPADSKLTAIENISTTNNFMIKGTAFTLQGFLQDKTLAEEYEGGTLLIFRLAPEDYHRFHFPCDCTPSKPKRIQGLYDSVNPVVYKAGAQPLVTNERHLIMLSKTIFSRIIMVPVGALCIGKIVETYRPSRRYKKGDEAGYFEFGGSTVALLFKKNTITVNPYILEKTEANEEVKVYMGEAIGRAVQSQE